MILICVPNDVLKVAKCTKPLAPQAELLGNAFSIQPDCNWLLLLLRWSCLTSETIDLCIVPLKIISSSKFKLSAHIGRRRRLTNGKALQS